MLLIEQVIKLLDDFHFNAFREHLKTHSKRSYYPLALVDVISRDIEVEQDTAKLCYDVYTEKDDKTRKKFTQLAHHTFKMTAFLARNYPDYLHHNISLIQRLINDKKVSRAIKLGEMLLEVSRKVEDFSTELSILKILSKLNFLFEDAHISIKYQKRIGEILKFERDLNEVLLFHLQNLGPKQKLKKENVEKNAAFFKQYENHESTALRLMSIYYYCQNFYLLRDDQFYEQKIYNILVQLENDFLKYDYIIFTFLTNFLHDIRFLKINFQIRKLKDEFSIEDAESLIGDKDAPLFLGSIVNYGEIFSLAIQSSYHITNSLKGFRDDREQIVPKETIQKIKFLQNYCERIIENELFEERFTLRYINMRVIYAAFLICGDKSDIKKAINVLEYTLISFQQVPFHVLVDTIYSILTIANFCLKQYEEVEKVYRRFKRVTKEKATISENENTIHGFYYASKWLAVKKPLFAKKFKKVIEESQEPNLKKTQMTLLEIAEYFKIPI